MNARHTLVKGAIGVFPEEEYAYWLVNTLSWSLPLMIVLGAIVDVLLVYENCPPLERHSVLQRRNIQDGRKLYCR